MTKLLSVCLSVVHKTTVPTSRELDPAARYTAVLESKVMGQPNSVQYNVHDPLSLILVRGY
jgi:hypothetical protein